MIHIRLCKPLLGRIQLVFKFCEKTEPLSDILIYVACLLDDQQFTLITNLPL